MRTGIVEARYCRVVKKQRAGARNERDKSARPRSIIRLQHRIHDRARLLGIKLAHQLRRALDVGKERCDRLALAISGHRLVLFRGDPYR